MSDISKCTDNKCPARNKCYRYRALPHDYWQSFADFRHDKTGKCSSFWDVTGYHKTQLLSLADSDRVIARMKSK